MKLKDVFQNLKIKVNKKMQMRPRCNQLSCMATKISIMIFLGGRVGEEGKGRVFTELRHGWRDLRAIAYVF